MNTNKAVLTIGAIGTIVLLGLLSAASPAFRPHATDIAVIALVFVCVTGIVAGVVTIVWPVESAPTANRCGCGQLDDGERCPDENGRRWGGDTR